MKVVLLAPTPPPIGGIAGWTVRMKNANLKNGWKVEIVDEKIIGKRQVFGNNTRKRMFNEIKRCLKIWRNLWVVLNDKDVKVVHSCIPAGTTGMLREYICAIITKMRKRKFIIHYRCTIPNMYKGDIFLFVFKILTKKSDLAIVLNKESVEFVQKYTNTQVKLIPNFIEETAIIDCHTRNISETVKTILYVGGVIETKGCIDIIEVAKRFPEIEFRFIGKHSSEIFKLANTPNVIFCGEKNKEELKKEYISADIFMFVTYFSGEGFSNALVEAMANGIPCIVSDWAANKDMIEDSGGIVVKPRDIDAMIEAINKLKDNKELRKHQSIWNINKVKTSYNDRVVTDMYVDQYEKIILN